MNLTWRDASDLSRGLGSEADAYTHWAAAGGIGHLQAGDGTGPCWVTFMVAWQEGQRWTKAVNALRRGERKSGGVLVTTLPKALDEALDFPFAALSVRLASRRGDVGQQIATLASRLLTRLGARRLELSLPMHQRHAHADTAVNDLADDSDTALEGLCQVEDSGARTDDQGSYRLLAVIDDVIPFGHHRVKPHLNAVWLQGQDSQGLVSEICLRAGNPGLPGVRPLRPDCDGMAAPGDLAQPQLRRELPQHWETSALHDEAVALGFGGVRRHISHGAHVVGLALGARSVRESWPDPEGSLPPPGEPMPPVSLVGVQLPWHAVRDTSGRWLGGHILAGLVYALDCAWFLPGRRQARNQRERRDGEAPRHVVANISFGHTSGPHDGSSLLEQAMDELCRRFDGSAPGGRRDGPPIRLDICLPAGNSFDARSHAAFTAPARGKARSLTWRVLPDGRRPAFLELWLDGLSRAGLTVTPPAGPPIKVDLAAGTCVQRQLHGGGPDMAGAGAVAFLRAAPVEGGRFLVLLALEPTALDDGAPAAPAGDWMLAVANFGASRLDVQAHVARATPHLYSRRDGTLSWLVDAGYDPERYLRRREDDAADGAQGPVKRRGTLSGIATGKASQVATGMLRRRREGHADIAVRVHAPYASAGSSETRTSRSPDVAYITDESRALPGVLGPGNHGASRARLVGTSTAAPQLARALLLGQRLPPPGEVDRGPLPDGEPDEDLLGRVQG